MNHKTMYMKMFKANYRKSLLLFICNAFLISVCLFFSTLTFNNGYNNTQAIQFVLEQNTQFPTGFVFLFAVFFIPYSHISYNTQKEKEYGVLETIGIDNSSIKYAVVLDNALIALSTLAAGLLLGTGYSVLFNKTFIKHIYPESTAGSLSIKGYEVTALIIGAIYFVTILCIEVYISGRTVKKLLTDERKAKEGHSPSKLLIIIGSALIIGNIFYIIFFYNINDNNALILCYFLIALGMLLILYNSLYFIDVLREKKPKLYYADILHLSDLRYRFSNNKKIFILTICLIGLVVYFQVFSFAVARSTQSYTTANNPFHVMYAEFSDENYPSTEELNELARNTDAEIVKTAEMPVYFDRSSNIVVSSDTLNKALGKDLDIRHGECIIYSQYSLDDGYRHEDKFGSTYSIMTDKLNLKYHIKSVKYKVLINKDMTPRYCIILNNKDYNDLISKAEEHYSMQYRIINCASLKQSERLYKTITAKYDMDANGIISSSKYINMALGEHMSALIILILSIMDLMIFMLNLMMIHFKLLANMDSDKKKYGIIHKLGFTEGEIKSTVQKNINTLMIWPVIIAVIFGGTLIIGVMRFAKETWYTTVCVIIVGAAIIIFQYILSCLYTKYYTRKLME